MKPELNKWSYGVKIQRDLMRMESGWKCFYIWCYKLHTMPEQGVMFDKRYYKGFRWGFRFFWPIESL